MTGAGLRSRKRRPAGRAELPQVSLSSAERSLLESVLRVQSSFGEQDLMRQHAAELAAAAGADVSVQDGNLYAVKGEADRYPCFVAHLDTVHDVVPADAYEVLHDVETDQYRAAHRLTGEPLGVGGDDKAGIFIALALLQQLAVCKVALFRDEEAGCQGADVADLSFFADCTFVAECDRPGTGRIDFSTRVRQGARIVVLTPESFRHEIRAVMSRHGFRGAVGKGTDVTRLRLRGLRVPCLNIACGYHNEHTVNEFVDTAEVVRALVFCRDLVLGFVVMDDEGIVLRDNPPKVSSA